MPASPARRTETSWFRSRGGRRFGVEFAAIVIGKVIVLFAIWMICFRPHPRPDTAPAAVADHLFAPLEVARDR
jgi:hypothetical protein